ncbi:MAG TPA: transcription-repair coupling factor [Aggregatilineales bacterium]|nr:transcription-repair coupling factor [Aggregatilineales bacterium]
MQLTGLLDLLQNQPVYRELLAQLHRAQALGDLGVLRSARPYLLAALARDWPGPVVYITARIDRAYNVSEQLPVWLGERPIYRFAEPAPHFYERAPWGETATRGRISTLAALAFDEGLPVQSENTGQRAGADANNRVPTDYPLIIASARAIMQRTLPVQGFRKATLTLAAGQRHVLDQLLARWVAMGYEPASIVLEPGSFSRRGGVLDIFPVDADQPIRIDFFDDEIDTIRAFDPASQRSAGKLERVRIPPAREALPDQTPPVGAHLRKWFESLPTAESDVVSPAGDAEPLANGSAFPYLEHYLPYLYPQPVSLLDYAPEGALVVIEDWTELRDTIAGIEEAAIQTRAERLKSGLLAPDHPLPYITWDALAEELDSRGALHLGYGRSQHHGEGSGMLHALFSPEDRYAGQLRELVNQMRQRSKSGDRVIVVTAQTARVADVWKEHESFLPLARDVQQPPPPHQVWLLEGGLAEGWHLKLPDGDLRLVSDAEIFGWQRPEPRRRKVQRKARLPESNYADLNEGDYVVHVDYGVGRFAGMRRRTLEGNEREYLVIEYAGTDVVFVPIHQADRITRYVGPDDSPPTLNKLGRADWAKITASAKRAVEEEATELLELYARRLATPGHACAPDTAWQHELEAAFPYVETEDQLRAIREVKADMERPMPMDRLICGEVGYGKTEVALRAAFKAVMGGMQVAVLVPTTVLAQQHYETFRNRLTGFPVKVEMLSRFRSKEEQRAALPLIAAGEIDILVGTHRLLSDDITFKNLGLVIIDEEQRFGVTHKEHLKSLRTQVDVLTLTATPIPRTLYMSLTGARDISMIQTPPEERLPVITHVGSYDDGLVRQAVIRELERGGQVFYVHNRIESMDAIREKLYSIVPEAKVVSGHGQMDERLLESVMVAFGRGEYDVLLATAIIENGIDIPNANTLIIDRADLFGLSQLYQLRGRVGRSAAQAYAYFFHPAHNRLTDEARMRLDSMAEYTDLGAGYQIALRDLELRGAGGILSTRQSGHVAAIGLNLYTRMLQESVAQMKRALDGGPVDVGTPNGTPGASVPEPQVSATAASITIDLPIAAYLPNDYIPEVGLRLQLYRRIGDLHSAEGVVAMGEELRDRFGPLPPAVEGLLYQIEVKLLAGAAGATAVLNLNRVVNIKLPYLPEIDREALERELRRRNDAIRVSRTAVLLPIQPEDWRAQLVGLLRALGREAVGEGRGI